MREIIIIDYGIGNVRSIYNALVRINAHPTLTNDAAKILKADGVILPGVGAFSHGMKNLHSHKLIDPILEYARSGKPFLGICLGMQMLLSESEEFGTTEGLGLIKGTVTKLKVKNQRLPHVSWNEIEQPEGGQWKSSLFNNITAGENMYFVHSFAANPESGENILSFTCYEDIRFCSAIYSNNIFGVQFHPEKSANAGLKVLENFVSL